MNCLIFRFSIAAAALLLIITPSCGEKAPSSQSNDPDAISALLDISYPDLAKLEPNAKTALDEMRTQLDQLLQAKDTPNSTLGLAFGKMGTLYFTNRFMQEALNCYRNAAFLQPDAYRWRYYLGRLHLEDQRTSEAQTALEKTLELQPKHTPSKVLLGQLAMARGEKETAESYFSDVLSTELQNAPALYAMGALLLEKGSYEEAAQHLQTCLLVQPYARATHGLLAKALTGMNQPEAAAIQERAKTDRKPILRDPLMDEVHNQRFLVLYRISEALRINQRDEDAVTLYNNSIDIRPDLSGPRLGRMISLIRLGKYQTAIETLSDDILAGEDVPNFKHILARLLAASPEEEVRNPEKALVILEELRQDHMSPALVETMAMALASLGKFKTAIQYQETAINLAVQTEQPNLLPSLEKNLVKYRQQEPCHQPWAEDDPFFKIVTYQGETQLQKRTGA